MTNRKNKPSIFIPNDALFKKIMEDVTAAQEFLEYYLPEDFKKLIDLSKLKVEKESYVDNNLKRSLSDLVYSVQTRDNEEAFVYVLIENQSTCDYWIAFRLWKYVLLLAERHKAKKNKLPLIAPLVLYNGRRKYDAPRNLWDLFTVPSQAKKLLAEGYQLIDLHSMPDDEIRKKQHLGMLEYFLKHIHQRDMLKLWENFLQEFNQAILIDRDKGFIYIQHFLWYTDSKVPEEQQQNLNKLILEHLSEENGENLMRSIAQKYFDEGIEKGFEKAAINMLKQKLDLKLITQITGLSSQQLIKLKNKI